MPDQKISELALLTAPADDDVLVVVDVDDLSFGPTGTNKKVLVSSLAATAASISSLAVAVVGGATSGETTITLDTPIPGLLVGDYVAIGAGSSTCEVRRVRAISGLTLTVAISAVNGWLKWPHAAGQPVLKVGFWVSPNLWGAKPFDTTTDYWRNLSNMFLDLQQAGGYFGIEGSSPTSQSAYYCAKPLWTPDGTFLRNINLIAKTPFGLDCTLGLWLYDNWPHQHFINCAGQYGTATFNAATNEVTFSTNPGAVSGEPVAFYVREGMGTLPGGIEEGRTYYTIESASTVRTICIDKWGTTPVDITDPGSGEICFWSTGNTRLVTDRVVLNGGGRGSNIRGLNGLLAVLQQPSNLKDLRVENFPGCGVTLSGQQSVWSDIYVTSCARIGIRHAGAQFIWHHGGNAENCDINFEFLDQSVSSAIGTAASGGFNNNCGLFGFHFEAPGVTSHLIWTVLITGTPTAGTWTLAGQTLDWDATAAEVQTACDTAFGAGNCVVTGGPLPGAQIVLSFQGIYQYGWGPSTIAVTNSITGGSYALTSVNPNAAQVSLKGGRGILIKNAVDSAAALPSGVGITFLAVEGIAASSASYYAHCGYSLENIHAVSNTGYFVTDPKRRNVSRLDADIDGAAAELAYYSAQERHGGAIGKHWRLVGDGGRQAAFGTVGVPLWELIGSTSPGTLEKLLRLQLGATPNALAWPLEIVDSAGAALAGVDTKGLITGALSRSKTVAVTQVSSLNPDASAGDWQTITFTTNTAMNLNQPSNAPAAGQTQVLTIEVFNNTGGAMGSLVWHAIWVFAGFTWTNPANGKRRAATFRWNGTNWICTGVSAADY